MVFSETRVSHPPTPGFTRGSSRCSPSGSGALGISFLLNRNVNVERRLDDGKLLTEGKSPLSLSFDASVGYSYDFLTQQPEARATLGFKITF